MVAARRAVARMLDTLGDGDRFSVLAFDSTIQSPRGQSSRLVPATDRNRFLALEFLSRVEARGGTEMAHPLRQGVEALGGVVTDRLRYLVLITDGQVGNEDQILRTLGKKLKGITVFTLGIDRAVNEAFLRRLAEQGGGSCELVESEERLDLVMDSIHRRIATPVLTDLELSSETWTIEPGTMAPEPLPALFAGAPLLLLGRYRGRPQGPITLRARDAAGRNWAECVPSSFRDNPAISTVWARSQVRKLEDRLVAGHGNRALLEQEITATSLRFGVLSRFTSFVAVDRARAVNIGGSLHQVTQPVEAPEGWVVADCAPSLLASDAYAAPESFQAMCEPPKSIGRAMFKAAPGGYSGKLRSSHSVQAEGPRSGAEDRERSALDDFESVTATGFGGFGAVYEARDSKRGESVAIRQIMLGSPNVNRLERTLRALMRLVHPSIVRILDVIRDSRAIFVVLERATGTSLQRVIQLGRLTPIEAACVMTALAEALQYAHEQGALHGDLTPASVVLEQDGVPRVTDFGIDCADAEACTALDKPAATIGTLAYMAPERLTAEASGFTALTDVYALGATFYHLLTGRPPYHGSTPVELAARVLHGDLIAPREVDPQIPEELETICLRALAKDPAGRYASAAEMRDDLQRFLDRATASGGSDAARAAVLKVLSQRVTTALGSSDPNDTALGAPRPRRQKPASSGGKGRGGKFWK
jgi:tRNA A-37 threonylcarbamoyl transferase component Bud32